MDPGDIKDLASLEAWLNTWPKGTEAEREAAQRVAVNVAARAALRVFPDAVGVRHIDLTLATSRALLVSGVAMVSKTPLINSAAYAASLAASVHGANAARAAAAATAAVYSVAAYADASAATTAHAVSASGTVWEVVRSDCGALAELQSLERAPLWPDDNPLEKDWDAAKRVLEGAGPEWGFWIDWYEKVLAGAPQDWQGLLTDVALIPPKDWDQGPAHVHGIIEKLKAKHAVAVGTPLSRAYPVDFSFDALARVMRMVGIDDDTAHLRDPAIVQNFVDDCDELKDTLRDFSDFAKAGGAGSNLSGMLHLAADRVLDELRRTQEQTHLRARHVVRLAIRLESFSKEKGARAELGDNLAGMLHDAIALLKTVTRKHLSPSYTALAPLSQLSLDQIDQDEILKLFDDAIGAIEALPSDELVALDQDGLNVLRDMEREARAFRAAIAEASTDEFRAILEARFAESLGGSGLALNRFVEMASVAAGGAGKAIDQGIKQYRRTKSLSEIWEALGPIFSCGGGGS